MRFKLQPVDIDFLEVAPIKLCYSIVINTTIEDVFNALDNPKTWPSWFPGMTRASEMEQNNSVPCRTVTLNYALNFREEFIVLEAPNKIAYRVSATTVPYADKLVEDFSLTQVSPGTTEITYRIGMEVHPSLKLFSGVVTKIGKHSYEQALGKLKKYLET